MLGLLGCSDLLLGQEGEVPSCSVAHTGFLLVGCSNGTAAAEETASGTTAAGSDADASDLD